MNIAFPALLIFLLFLPGFLLRSSFRKTEKTQLDFKPLANITVVSVLMALFLHAVWGYCYYLLCGKALDYQTVLTLMVGQRGELLELAVAKATVHSHEIFIYFSTLIVLSWFLGSAARSAIIRWRWDQHPRLGTLLKFDTPWFYLFKGYGFDKGKEPDLVWVSAIADLDGGAYLYIGLLEDWFFDASGNLDRLVLSMVSRRRLIDDKSNGEGADAEDDSGHAEEERFYPVDGDYFVIRYAEVITLNIRYVRLTYASPPSLEKSQDGVGGTPTSVDKSTADPVR